MQPFLAALPSPISPTRRPALVSRPLSRHRHLSPSSHGFSTTCPCLPAVGQAARCPQCACILSKTSLLRVSTQVRRIAEYCLLPIALDSLDPACPFCTGLRYNQWHGSCFSARRAGADILLLWLDASTRMPRAAVERRPQLPFQPPKAVRRLCRHMHVPACVHVLHVAFHMLVLTSFKSPWPVPASPSLAGGVEVRLLVGCPSGKLPHGT